MEKNGMTTNQKDGEQFKKPDRIDRGKTTSNDSSPNVSRYGAPKPNNDSHKPKIVPWK